MKLFGGKIEIPDSQETQATEVGIPQTPKIGDESGEEKMEMATIDWTTGRDNENPHSQMPPPTSPTPFGDAHTHEQEEAICIWRIPALVPSVVISREGTCSPSTASHRLSSCRVGALKPSLWRRGRMLRKKRRATK